MLLFHEKPENCRTFTNYKNQQGYIYCKILWGGNGAGEKMKTEAVKTKWRGKEKEKKEKGESDFFCWYMAHTFVVNCVLTWSYDCMFGPLRGKMAAGEKI